MMRTLGTLLFLAVAGAQVSAVDAIRPNPTRTPGLARPLTTTQVCTTTWGRDARSVTVAMKRQVAQAYGVDWSTRARYEFDHLISRELGGADDVRNLWPQPRSGRWTAAMKDRLENRLNREVCAGTLSLAAAQHAIAADWIGEYMRRFGAPQ